MQRRPSRTTSNTGENGSASADTWGLGLEEGRDPRIALLRSIPGRVGLLGIIGAVIVVLVGVTALAGPGLVPYGKDDVVWIDIPVEERVSPSAVRRLAILAGPSLEHPLGTDSLGRDLMTRVIHGSRIALMVGFFAAAIGTAAGTVIGVASGYFGGIVDIAMQRVVDSIIAMPGIVILLLFTQVGERNLTLTVSALGFLGTFSAARVLRAATLSVRGEVYMEAARSTGASDLRMMFRHILPNIVAPIVIIFSISVGTNILAESGLAFLNLSVPGPSWGNMVSEGRAFLDSKPMMSMAAGGAITLTVLGFNLLGDGIRDGFDPTRRSG